MAGEKLATLQGERVVKTSGQAPLSLTNYRVIFSPGGAGSSRFLSIPLDAVSSCGVVGRSMPGLLFVAVMLVVGAFLVSDQPVRIFLMVIAVMFVLAFFFIRPGVITTSSSGGENMVVPVSSMNASQIIPFLDAVLEAKLDFVGRRAEVQPLPESAMQGAAIQEQQEETGPMGKCPNCKAVIPLSAAECKNCKALFGGSSSWSVERI